MSFTASNLREVVFDFADPPAYVKLGAEVPCDLLLCAQGTTMKVAGSPVVGVVSSVGADRPSNLNLRTKHEMEVGLRVAGLPQVITRPSFLLGERKELRLGIAFFGKPLGMLSRLFPNTVGLVRFAPIPAEQVAAALLRHCLDERPPASGLILEGLALTLGA